MKTAEIRRKFLRFFESKGHTIVESSSLVPHEDPTLLFTNAGMNQFKDVFLGFDKRPYNRATTSQKCVRAGGKHNDLENVGYTARHHTFFEMLGNFSFGDYFKREAIHFAWEFLTSKDYLGIEESRLMATVYAEDDEAYDIWNKEIGLGPDRIVRIGDNKGAKYASDNFWQMGDTGPCGPCSEIFYDHGESVQGGPPGSPDEDGDRYTEIWNCVFMQFNRDEKGNMNPLPKPSVDTGMGLERISAVMQGVHSNYEIDLFVNLIRAAAKAVDVDPDDERYRQNPSLKVIADHIRACSFLIADGVLPGNLGRGYVLRRIIRRAVRHGYKLGKKEPFFHTLVDALANEMGEAYPELLEKRDFIKETLRNEESSFAKTIANGMSLLENELGSLGKGRELSGEVAFKLYDTYGFPFDLTADICREKNVTVDEAGFDKEMAAQKKRAREASHFKTGAQLEYDGAENVFTGYETTSGVAKIIRLYKDNDSVEVLKEGDEGVVVLDNTPFYAESGGQVGDVGVIDAKTGVFEVHDTQKIKASVHGHKGVVKMGEIRVGEECSPKVDNTMRDAIKRNHSVTHLMHAALRTVLGDHVTQQGSLVDSERTRFDFLHGKPMTIGEIEEVEKLVNSQILANVACEAKVLPKDEALKLGAMHLFNEKYGDMVRVLVMGDFSIEFCGGTHVARTGDIGFFKIVSEGGIAAGIRRVEAITGMNALEWVQRREEIIRDSMAEVKANQVEDLSGKLKALVQHGKDQDKRIAELKRQIAIGQSQKLLDAVEEKDGYGLVVKKMDEDVSLLKDLAQDLVGRKDNLVIVLVSTLNDRVSVVAGVSKGLHAKLKAGDLVKELAAQLGGKGGGRPDVAQGGGTDVAKLDAVLSNLESTIGNSFE